MTQQFLKVWHILSGPYHRDEVGEAPDDLTLNYMLLCKYELRDEVKDQEFWFETFEETQDWIKHFQSSIEPIKIPVRWV